MQKINRQPNNPNRTNTLKIFLGGLPTESSEEHIVKILKVEFGIDVLDIFIKRRKNRSKCLGHGTLRISKCQSSGLLRAGYFTYKDRSVRVEPCLEGKDLILRREALKQRRIFLRNLSSETTQQLLKWLMVKYGNVESCYLRGEPGTKLLVGVVIFSTQAEAKRVIEELRQHKEAISSELNSKDIEIGFSFKRIPNEQDPTSQEKSSKKRRRKKNKKRGKKKRNKNRKEMKDKSKAELENFDHSVKPSRPEYFHCRRLVNDGPANLLLRRRTILGANNSKLLSSKIGWMNSNW